MAAHAALGYDLAVSAVRLTAAGGKQTVTIRVVNRGVAPFYYDWPIEFAVFDGSRKVVETVKVRGKLPSILPGQSVEIAVTLSAAAGQVAVRVPNPMAGGAPLKFANVDQDAQIKGWLSLGNISKTAQAAAEDITPVPRGAGAVTQGEQDSPSKALPQEKAATAGEVAPAALDEGKSVWGWLGLACRPPMSVIVGPAVPLTCLGAELLKLH